MAKARSMRLLRRQLMDERPVDVERLRVLAGRNGERHGVEPARLEGAGQRAEPPVADPAIGETMTLAPLVVYENRNIREFVASRIGGYVFTNTHGLANLNTFFIK